MSRIKQITPGEWFPVLFGDHWNLMDADDCSARDVLRERDGAEEPLAKGVSAEAAAANAYAAAASPEMFAALKAVAIAIEENIETDCFGKIDPSYNFSVTLTAAECNAVLLALKKANRRPKKAPE